MRKTVIGLVVVSFLAVVLVVAARAWSAAQGGSSAASDKAAIEAQVAKYKKAFEAKDVNAIMAAYASGTELFVFDAIPPREYPSADSYRKDWEGLFAMFPGPVKDSISELNVTVAGPVAYSHRIEDTHFTDKNGADKELVVRETDVYRKMNGKWLIVQEHVSFPVNPVTGQADLLSKP
jgi:ketosteroid isomerase-like protein